MFFSLAKIAKYVKDKHIMEYYSTRNLDLAVSLDKVILIGLAEDGGLYLPKVINKLDSSFWDQASNLTYNQILIEVLKTLTAGDDYNFQEVSDAINSVFTFEPKIIRLEDNRFLLDLNTGPTSAFKDYGANTLGVYLDNVAKAHNSTKTVLVATSGDTGSAVANAFKDYGSDPAIKVIVLYPKGRVSVDQRKLMTTVGGNITCLEVDGNFDDCQKLVKEAMSDDSIRAGLTSANSINLIRLYGQVAYYIYATSRIGLDKDIIFSVPSGNLGNLTAGYIAKEMGNNTLKFIVSHNSNDMFNIFILEGLMNNRQASIPTISSAMDVYRPSNLERLVVLFGGQYDKVGNIKVMPDISKMQNMFYVQGFNDEDTKVKMKEINTKYDIEIDPHTAVGLLGVDHSINTEHPEFNDYTIVTLSTAHASKFNEVFTSVNGKAAQVSQPIIKARLKDEIMIGIPNQYQSFYKIIKTMIKH
jgi:threonine synthase